MKTWLSWILFAGFLIVPLAAKEAKPPGWLKNLPEPQAGQFPLPDGRELRYTAGWAGLTAGSLSVTFAQEKGRQRLHATGKTVGLARIFFALDADCSAECNAITLAPDRTTIQENYSDEKRTTVQQFQEDQIVRTRTSIPAEKDDGKNKVIALPHVLDLQSSLLYLRSQPLQTGDVVTFLSYATGAPYLARVTVVKREIISVPAGRFPAIQLHLDLTGIDKKLNLKSYKKARDINAWISDDADRLYLKFTAEMLVGAVFVELEK